MKYLAYVTLCVVILMTFEKFEPQAFAEEQEIRGVAITPFANNSGNNELDEYC